MSSLEPRRNRPRALTRPGASPTNGRLSKSIVASATLPRHYIYSSKERAVTNNSQEFNQRALKAIILCVLVVFIYNNLFLAPKRPQTPAQAPQAAPSTETAPSQGAVPSRSLRQQLLVFRNSHRLLMLLFSSFKKLV